jgi:Protein of unknown function (DUF3078)
MRKIALLFVAVALSSASIAQDVAREAQAVASKTVKNEGGKKVGSWVKGGAFSVNVNQGGYDNWLPAGDADWSVGANGFINLFANKSWAGKKKGKVKSWTNNLDIFEGILSTHDERTNINSFNKLDDRIDFLSRYSILLKKTVGIASVLNVRTQLYDTKAGGKRVSGFFAPAIVTFIPIGFEWKPNSWFNAYASPLSNRWVIVSNGPNQIAANIPNSKPFGVDPSRQVDYQLGTFIQLNLNKDLNKAKTVSLSSRLDLYSNYRNNPENIDVFFTNLLNMKVTKWFGASIGLTMIYDDDIKQFGFGRNRAGLQYNHAINIGVTRKF